MNKNIFHISTRHHNKRVLYQLVIFLLISLVMLGIVLFDIWKGELSVLLAFAGIVLGIVVGYLVGRMYAIKWHEETQKVIVGIDKTGFLVIILYIVFRIFGRQFFGEFLHGDTLTAFTFCMLGGIMIGRLFSMYRNILKILREQKILN